MDPVQTTTILQQFNGNIDDTQTALFNYMDLISKNQEKGWKVRLESLCNTLVVKPKEWDTLIQKVNQVANTDIRNIFLASVWFNLPNKDKEDPVNQLGAVRGAYSLGRRYNLLSILTTPLSTPMTLPLNEVIDIIEDNWIVDSIAIELLKHVSYQTEFKERIFKVYFKRNYKDDFLSVLLPLIPDHELISTGKEYSLTFKRTVEWNIQEKQLYFLALGVLAIAPLENAMKFMMSAKFRSSLFAEKQKEKILLAILEKYETLPFCLYQKAVAEKMSAETLLFLAKKGTSKNEDYVEEAIRGNLEYSTIKTLSLNIEFIASKAESIVLCAIQHKLDTKEIEDLLSFLPISFYHKDIFKWSITHLSDTALLKLLKKTSYGFLPASSSLAESIENLLLQKRADAIYETLFFEKYLVVPKESFDLLVLAKQSHISDKVMQHLEEIAVQNAWMEDSNKEHLLAHLVNHKRPKERVNKLLTQNSEPWLSEDGFLFLLQSSADEEIVKAAFQCVKPFENLNIAKQIYQLAIKQSRPNDLLKELKSRTHST